MAASNAPGVRTSNVNAARRAQSDQLDLGEDPCRQLCPVKVPDRQRYLNPPREPSHPLYQEAQLIFDGIGYFNERVSGDLISIQSHFNPYRVDMARIDKIPRIYISMLVTVATLHRAMQDEADERHLRPVSAVVRSREQDIFRFRIKALQNVNDRLSNKDTQTSDSTLMCVLCLLMCTIQQSAYSDWRAHLEGARTIIRMRGGLKQIAAENHYFRPLLVMFVAIDVMAATTTSTQNRKMAEATSMALHYWEAAPNMFQANLAISAPCPEALFQSLILANYLRTTIDRPASRTRRHGGTRMLLEKIRSFDLPQWAARMKKFRGWKRSGESVDFEDDEGPLTRTMTASSGTSSNRVSPDGQREKLSPTSAEGSPSLTGPSSPRTADPNLWLNVGIMYHSAVLLYVVRTLLLDINEDKSFLLEVKDSSKTTSWVSESGVELLEEIENLQHRAHVTLLETLRPILSDLVTAREVGKLVFFPAFMCGMELSGCSDRRLQKARDEEGILDDARWRDFVASGLELMGQACGTLAPMCAAEEVRTKWAWEAQQNRRIGWDEYFAARPDFTFGF